MGLNLISKIGHTDDGDSGGRNMLLKNNMWLNILIKVHLLVCHKSIKHSLINGRLAQSSYRLLYVPADLTFSNSTFCPHSVFMCFVWISEQTTIISLYSINWLGFITETGSVYCAVRNGYLNTIRVNLSLRSAHTPYLCVLCGSQNKQRLFPCTALTDWVL